MVRFIIIALLLAIQKHPGYKKGEAKPEAPVNVKAVYI